ncbi:MAG: hypothetical protein CMH53_02815 [Myxococcales bacterium]|nr:hypothetical protein [Myxococcales bacterium]
MIRRAVIALTLIVPLALSIWPQPTGANGVLVASKVYLNGVPHPVFFNDGDSFRVLAGSFAGTKARLAGYNTLESYGYTHSWGAWSAKELYHNAKMGTYNARKGVWRCTSDLKRDGYGRILWWCPRLAEDQIRKGLAHAMSVRGPANAKLIEVQREAIKHKRGMWAHGVPRYVVTSLHSADEHWFKGLPYNRMVSTVDGSSRKWRHRKRLKECTKVCWHDVTITKDSAAAGIAVLKQSPSLTPYLSKYNDSDLADLLASYAGNEDLGVLKPERSIADKSARYAKLGVEAKHFDKVLAKIVSDGLLTIATKKKGSCMVHAAYTRRYGRGAASCLH